MVDIYPEAHRYLQFESSIQGVMSLADHRTPVLEYIGVMARAISFLPIPPERIWLGGLGSCSLLHAGQTHWKNAHFHTIESSRMVYELARRFFRLDPRSEITIGDLRQVLDGPAFEACNVLLMDCYSAVSIPQHLTTVEFWYLVYKKLRSGGLLISNLWSPDCNKICGDQVRTLLEVFQEVTLAFCQEDENIIAIAAKEPHAAMPETIDLRKRVYPLMSLSLRRRKDWPDFMRDCGLLEDNNVAKAFESVGYLP